jgi:signal transduction histidine kinase
VVSAAIARCSDRQPQPVLASQADRACLVFANREQLAGIVEHAIRNAQDASPEQRVIAVEITVQGETVEICVADEGVGMSAEFIRDRLFRPFDTTKGSRGMGVGAYQVREYVLSLGGKVNVHSIPEKGTRFSLCIPLRAIK